jgi:hypothetical protein
MHEKIAELSMAANQEPGAINWEIIPEAPIYNDLMDIDSCLNEWEDIFEENMDPKGKAVIRLQTVILCAFPLSLPSHIWSCYRAFGGSTKHSYPTRSRLEHRRTAERAWITVLPLLIDPYLIWKHSCATSHLKIESDIVWPVPMFGLEGLYDDQVLIFYR